MCVCVCVCVCACVCVLDWYEDGNRRQTYKKTVRSMCDWCQLVKTACTHSLCRHVTGVVCSSVWCLCVCKKEDTPDSLHHTTSSCRDWLLVRLARHDWRKLMSNLSELSSSCKMDRMMYMSDQARSRSIFCRCCALATLDDTLHQSSVVGYMCKTIQ